VPYTSCSLAALLMNLGRLKRWTVTMSAGTTVVAALAFVYSIVAIIGAGREVIVWGAVLLAAGLPVYFWMRLARPKLGTSEGGRG